MKQSMRLSMFYQKLLRSVSPSVTSKTIIEKVNRNMNTSTPERKSAIQIARDSNGRFIRSTTAPAIVAATLATVGSFLDGHVRLRVHVVPRLVSDNVAYGENAPVFMVRNDADPRNAIQCRTVRFTGEVRGVFDSTDKLRGSQTAAWMETNAPVYVTDESGYEFLLNSQEVWKNNRNFDYDTNQKYACGQAPSDNPEPAPKPMNYDAPAKKWGC